MGLFLYEPTVRSQLNIQNIYVLYIVDAVLS